MNSIIKYRLKDGGDAEYTIEAERVEEAQLIWDSMAYLRDAYYVVTPRPVPRTFLITYLYDYVGEDREVADSKFSEFITSVHAVMPFPNCTTPFDPLDLTVPDSDLPAWVRTFEKWLASGNLE